MTLAEQLRGLAKQADDFARVFGIVDQGSMGIKAELHAQQLRTLADEAGKLQSAVATFDVMLFPDDGDRNPADTARMREKIVKHMAQFMDDQGWAGLADENRDLIDQAVANFRRRMGLS